MQITKTKLVSHPNKLRGNAFSSFRYLLSRGYNAAPALLMLIGLGYGVYALIKKPLLNLSKVDKYLIYSYLFILLPLCFLSVLMGENRAILILASQSFSLFLSYFLLLK